MARKAKTPFRCGNVGCGKEAKNLVKPYWDPDHPGMCSDCCVKSVKRFDYRIEGWPRPPRSVSNP